MPDHGGNRTYDLWNTTLSCIITGGPAPILRSVNQVKPKTWRIFRQNHDAISMTTGP